LSGGEVSYFGDKE